MAKRTKSALKANRQNIKRREANRQMRSRLRTALKAIRASLDGNDIEGAKAALSRTVSMVDKAQRVWRQTQSKSRFCLQLTADY